MTAKWINDCNVIDIYDFCAFIMLLEKKKIHLDDVLSWCMIT